MGSGTSLKTSESFDDGVKRLGELAFDMAKIDEFTDLYQNIMDGQTFMLMLGKLSSDDYSIRLTTMRGILHEQVRFLGAEPPRARVNDA